MGFATVARLGNGVTKALKGISEAFSPTDWATRDPRKLLCGHGKSARQGYQPFVTFILLLIMVPQSALALHSISQPPRPLPPLYLTSRTPNQTAPVLEVFQISPPVLIPKPSACKQTLMVHSFGWSYGKPFVGESQLLFSFGRFASPLSPLPSMRVCSLCI